MQRRAFTAALALAATGSAWATVGRTAPPEVLAELGRAQLAGSGRLRWLGFHVYDARLWTAGPLSAAEWALRPAALEIEYARSLEGRAIAERSIDEIRRQRELAPELAARWLAALAPLVPDVKPGDRLTGVHRPGEGLRLFANGAARGELRDPEFARLFFGIWLSDQTSQPALRTALLGSGAGAATGGAQ